MRIFLSAGEPSGDLYGALIGKELKRYGDVEGMGGEEMRRVGVRVLRDIEGLSVFGFSEGLFSYPLIRKVMRRLLNYLRRNPPDIFVPIAFSGFHLLLLQHLPHLTTIYLAPPQLWAWGKWRKYFLRRIHKIICLFPFEESFFRRIGMDAVYLGNPLLDYVKGRMRREELFKLYKLDPDVSLLTLMPGSRPKEVRYHLPLMLEVLRALRREDPKVMGFVISKKGPALEGVIYTQENRYDIMAQSRLVLLSSGTAALEAAILQVPFVSIYRLSPISWIIAKLMVKLENFSLPNIIASKELMPELAQPSFRSLYPLVLKVWKDSFRLRKSLKIIKELLGPKDAAKRVARWVVKERG